MKTRNQAGLTSTPQPFTIYVPF